MFKAYVSDKIINFLGTLFFNNEKDDSIIEPLTCLIRLSILEFKPLNTKLSISNNRITYDDPTVLQGALRWSNGDKREDIHNIFNPIRKAGEWFDLENEDICTIFRFGIKGLEKLKLSYNENSTIAHSIEYYIFYLKNKVNKDCENENSKNDDSKVKENNTIYTKLRELWNKREIEIIKNILLELDDNRSDSHKQESMIEAIESILHRKEESVQNLLHETVTSFK